MIKEHKRSFITAENVINISLALFALLLLLGSRNYSTEAKRFPQVVAGATLILSLYVTLKNCQHIRKAAKDANPAENGQQAEQEKAETNYNWLIIIGAGFAYYLLLKPLGFIITTLALMSSIPVALGYRKYKVVLPLAIILTLSFYWIFTSFFYIPLPKGLLF